MIEVTEAVMSPRRRRHSNILHSTPVIVLLGTYTEYPSVQRIKECKDGLSTLISLRAPAARGYHASVDLVLLLDVSSNMEGTKLGELNRAVEFVIGHLRGCDRLSIVTFSPTAECILPLCCMGDNSNRAEAMKAATDLQASGCRTSIAHGLSKAFEVLLQREDKAMVEAVLLFSDGHRKCGTTTPSAFGNGQRFGFKQWDTPVHVFGFGDSHDSFLLKSIAEASRGTYSFIEHENHIGEAFAQCIAGLKTVIVQEMDVEIECVHPDVRLVPPYSSAPSIFSGAHPSYVSDDGCKGSIRVGEMYAEERRDFLVNVFVPVDAEENCTTHLYKVRISYREADSGICLTMTRLVKLPRTRQRSRCFMPREGHVVLERKRQGAIEDVAAAMRAAENGDFAWALKKLTCCQKWMRDDCRAKNDMLLERMRSEMQEIKRRMWDRESYMRSGRPLVFAFLSSHLQQRATASQRRNPEAAEHGGSDIAPSSYRTPAMKKLLKLSRKERRVGANLSCIYLYFTYLSSAFQSMRSPRKRVGQPKQTFLFSFCGLTGSAGLDGPEDPPEDLFQTPTPNSSLIDRHSQPSPLNIRDKPSRCLYSQ